MTSPTQMPAYTVALLSLATFAVSEPCHSQMTVLTASRSGQASKVSQPDLPDAPGTMANVTEGQASQAGLSVGSGVYYFPTGRQRSKQYIYDLVGPGAFISALVQATVDATQPLKVGYPPDGLPGPGEHPAHGVVPEWEQGAQGFGKRYGSRFGMGLVGTSTRYGLSELLRQDTSYHRCECSGFFSRSFHAVEESVIAHTRSGRAVPSLPALVAPFVAAEVGTVAWYPARYNASDAFRTSTSLYYGLPIKNVIKEFTGR